MPQPGVSLFTVVDHKNYTALLFFKKKNRIYSIQSIEDPVRNRSLSPHHHLNVLGYVIGRHKEGPLIHLSIAWAAIFTRERHDWIFFFSSSSIAHIYMCYIYYYEKTGRLYGEGKLLLWRQWWWYRCCHSGGSVIVADGTQRRRARHNGRIFFYLRTSSRPWFRFAGIDDPAAAAVLAVNVFLLGKS